MASVRAHNASATMMHRVAVGGRAETPTSIAAEMPQCVYAVRTPDRLVKIGYTTDLDRRIRGFGSKWTDVLLVISADQSYEKALHHKFAPYLARGREYYFPAIEVMEWINAERALLGVTAA